MIFILWRFGSFCSTDRVGFGIFDTRVKGFFGGLNAGRLMIGQGFGNSLGARWRLTWALFDSCEVCCHGFLFCFADVSN